MVKVTLKPQKICRHLFLKHWHLSLTNITCLFLTTQGLLTASLEEIRMPAEASGTRQELSSMRQVWEQSPHSHSIATIKNPADTSKTLQRGPAHLLDCLCQAKGEASLPGLATEWVIKIFLPPPPPLSWVSSCHCHLSIFLRYVSNVKMGSWAVMVFTGVWGWWKRWEC